MKGGGILKQIKRIVLLLALIFIVVPTYNVLGASFNGVSREDTNYYYYDGGIVWYWGYNWHSTALYEDGWGRWADAYPNIDYSTMYNNQDIFGDRVIGSTAEWGFQATGAWWIGSVQTGSTGAPSYVNRQRKVGHNYRRAKTTPVSWGVDLFNAKYISGNNYWYTPWQTFGVRAWGHQDYNGWKIRLNDKVSHVNLNAQGSGINWVGYQDLWGGDSAWNLDNNRLGYSFGSNWHQDSDANMAADFYLQPKEDNMDLNMKVYVGSLNGKNTGSYIDSGKWARTDGTAPSHIGHSIWGHQWQNGNDYWVLPGTQIGIASRQWDGRSGNKYNYIRLVGSGQDSVGMHTPSSGASSLSTWGTNWAVPINSQWSSENQGGYVTANYYVTPNTSGHFYDVMYYHTDNVDNVTGYVDTGMNLRVDGDSPTVQFRNTADTANYTSRDWGSSIDVKLKFSDSLSGYKQSRYVWSTSSTTPTSGWSAWTTSADYNVSKAQSGQWYLHVEAQDNLGNTVSTKSGVYKYNTAPVSNFSFSPTTVYNNTTVSFTNSSTDSDGQALTYTWEAQAPNSTTWTQFSTVANPTRTFTTKGDWTIRLTASDGIASHSTTKILTVSNRAPVSNFSFSPSTIYNNTTVTFINSSSDADGDTLTYKWDYQQPNSTTWTQFSTSKDPTRVLEKQGTWNIRLTVTDSSGVTHLVSKGVTVTNRQPTSSFTVNPSTTNRLTNVSFSSTSSDLDGDTLTYKYEYRKKGDTAWVSMSTTASTTFKFASLGVFEVRLTVTDPYASSHSLIKEVTVNNLSPVSNFTYTPNPTTRLINVQFTSTSTDPEGDALTSYTYEYRKKGATTWLTMSTLANPTFKFTDVGIYELRLTVVDQHGGSSTSTKEITVNNLSPTAKFTAVPNPSNRLTNVVFTNQSTDPENDTLTYKYEYRKKGTLTWGTMSTSASPSFKFTEVATYEVRLTVTDQYGGTNTSAIQEIINNNLNPVADFMANPNPSDRLTSIQFTNKSSDPENDSLTYKYEYRKKTTPTWLLMSTSSNPTFKFNDVGVFEVRLTVTDSYGAVNSLVKEITVNNLSPTSNFTIIGSVNYEGDVLKATNQSTDPEGDTLTAKWTVIYPNGTSGVFTTWDLTIPTASSGTYSIKLEVTDLYNAKHSVTKSTQVVPLTINSKVGHTAQWKAVHDYNGGTELQFYSGESFELTSDVSNYPISRLRVTLTGYDVTNQVKTEVIDLTSYTIVGSYRRYTGSLYKDWMTNPTTRMRNGQATFRFEVVYTNGVVKSDSVNIEIVDTVYETYDFHRTN